jgi:hypothetical protein
LRALDRAEGETAAGDGVGNIHGERGFAHFWATGDHGETFCDQTGDEENRVLIFAVREIDVGERGITVDLVEGVGCFFAIVIGAVGLFGFGFARLFLRLSIGGGIIEGHPTISEIFCRTSSCEQSAKHFQTMAC